MNRTVKDKLIHLWNRSLRSLMIGEGQTDDAHPFDEHSYEALSSVLSAIPDLMFEVDEEGRYWDVRVLRPELLVAPAEELIGHTINEALPEDAARTAMQAIEEAKKMATPMASIFFCPHRQVNAGLKSPLPGKKRPRIKRPSQVVSALLRYHGILMNVSWHFWKPKNWLTRTR